MEYITATKYYIDYLAVLFDYIYYKIKGVFGRAPAMEKQLQSCRSTQFRHGAAPPWI
jgi:hypothetical protein